MYNCYIFYCNTGALFIFFVFSEVTVTNTGLGAKAVF